MRDLSTDELGHVYGAGGRGCSPRPPSCGGGGSKSRHSKSKHSKKNSKKSRGRGSRGC
jgi:hypothetical protein